MFLINNICLVGKENETELNSDQGESRKLDLFL